MRTSEIKHNEERDMDRTRPESDQREKEIRLNVEGEDVHLRHKAGVLAIEGLPHPKTRNGWGRSFFLDSIEGARTLLLALFAEGALGPEDVEKVEVALQTTLEHLADRDLSI